MIVNNGAYLNYLTTFTKPSNDVDALSDSNSDNASPVNNIPVTLPANMDSLDITSSVTPLLFKTDIALFESDAVFSCKL